MKEYRVTWAIELAADSPQHAAQLAREIQLSASSIATVFDVYDAAGNRQEVDVGEAQNANT
jgi:hypothetical protein